jgi:hypothetical protein
MTLEDYFPKAAAAQKEQQKRPRRRIAGWASGKFSRTGTEQVTRLKGGR